MPKKDPVDEDKKGSKPNLTTATLKQAVSTGGILANISNVEVYKSATQGSLPVSTAMSQVFHPDYLASMGSVRSRFLDVGGLGTGTSIFPSLTTVKSDNTKEELAALKKDVETMKRQQRERDNMQIENWDEERKTRFDQVLEKKPQRWLCHITKCHGFIAEFGSVKSVLDARKNLREKGFIKCGKHAHRNSFEIRNDQIVPLAAQ